MRTRLKSLLALALTFVAGGLVGVTVAVSHPGWFRSFRQPPGPERAVEYLTDMLDLTSEQRKRVRKVFVRLHPQFVKESERARAFRKDFMVRHFNEMEPILDERQKAVAREFLNKHLNRDVAPPPPPEEAKTD